MESNPHTMSLFSFRRNLDNINDSRADDDIEAFNSIFEINAFQDLEDENIEDITNNSVFNRKRELCASDQPIQVEKKNSPGYHSSEILSDYESADSTSDREGLKLWTDEINLAVVWNNKGVALSRSGRFEEAVHAYDRALSLNGEYVTALNNKGVALSKIGRYNEAIGVFDRILDTFFQEKECTERYPQTPEVYSS